MELDSVGQVKSSAQIRDDRIRKGYCGTCHVNSNPTKCYDIKKRFGGLNRKRIPLTVEGEVLRGVCLICHPEMDPNPTSNNRRRASSDRVLSGDGLPTSSNTIPQNQHNSAPPVLQQPPLNLSSGDVEIREEIAQNIFGQPIIVERPQVVPRPVMQSGEAEEQGRVLQEEEQAMNNSSDIETPPKTDSNNSSMHVQPSSSHNESDDNRDSTAELAEKLGSGGGGLDALARAIAAACLRDPGLKEEIARTCFKPGDSFVPNAELSFEERTVASDLTDPTFISVDTRNMRGEAAWQHPQPKEASRVYSSSRGLAAIDEIAESQSTTSIQTPTSSTTETRSSSSTIKQRSIASHQIHEPDVSEYFEPSPDLSTLREFVDMFMQCGEDAQAISVITDELIKDNAKRMSVDLALYCLHTLWILARKSDENKHEILLEGNTFEAIIEAMEIYNKRSAEIQMKACGLIWSLAMDGKDRRHVAELRGCGAVLDASLAYKENESLQEMALGALKVLSFDPTGKLKLRHAGAAKIVADVMSNHVQNPTIQSEGCVVISNLATEADGFVNHVSNEEVDAILAAIINNPDAPRVVQVACFTLTRLSNSTENVEALKRARHTTLALDIAIQMHPGIVGVDVQAIIKRLR